MDEMIVDSLKINAMGQRVMILKQKKGPLFLAIWIAAAEADAIAIRMQKVDVPRPLTHDLFCNMVENFGGKIQKIIIVGHSQGCLVGIDFASKYPEFIDGLVLVAGSYKMPVNQDLIDESGGRDTLLDRYNIQVGSTERIGETGFHAGLIKIFFIDQIMIFI